MTDYAAPLKDMRFVLTELAGLDAVARMPGCEEASPDLVDAILDEAAKYAAGVLSPLNQSGDREGARLDEEGVHTASGFRQAYRQFVEGGWSALSADPDFGGQGLPMIVATPVNEMWHAANMSFALCPLLTQAAIEALQLRGSAALKKTFLPRMVSGEWAGTMNLTEPQAGSDLAAVRTGAEPEGDHYRLHGQKIFITYGEHDLTDNIVHLVLARTPDAPPGVKGISLFLVPKFLVNEDGSLGRRNDVRCVSLEHKLGIHASPTAVMAYGEREGAVGYLVGEENRGLEYMFIMMNLARFGVGLEGVAIAERAYQQARDYARQRVQGRPIGERGGESVAIVHHPDVRRMLMSMKARIEAMRALAYVTAAAFDEARCHRDEASRTRAQAFVDLLIPVVKGWSTEAAVQIASMGIQVHGGMGFIEETGAAQHLRDARITTIYEGTTGIQANDFIGRKIARDQGAGADALITAIRRTADELGEAGGDDFGAIREALAEGADALERAVGWVVSNYAQSPQECAAGSVPLLELAGVVAGGWQMARAALAAQRGLRADGADAAFLRAKIATARFYADHVLTRAAGLAHTVAAGAPGVLALDQEQF